MSDKISGSDLFDDSSFEALKNLKQGFEDLIRLNKEFIEGTKFNSAKDIKEFSKAVIEASQAEKALIQVKQAEEKLNQEVYKSISQEEKAKTANAKATYDQAKAESDLQKLRDKANQQLQQAQGAYAKLNKELNENRKRAKDLLAENRALSASEQQVIKKVQELDNQLKLIDKQLGQSQRFVGEYERGFHGLKNSINQVTREMPAFVNSAQTGFMAISNNLPIVVDEIQKLRQQNIELASQGKETQSVLKSLAGAVFSFGTFISLAITALTIFGPKIIEYFTGGSEAAEKAAKETREYNKELQNSRKEAERLADQALDDLLLSFGIITEFQARINKAKRDVNQETEKIEQETAKKLAELRDKEIESEKKFSSEITRIRLLTGSIYSPTESLQKIAELNGQKLLEEQDFQNKRKTILDDQTDREKAIFLKSYADLNEIRKDALKKEKEDKDKAFKEDEDRLKRIADLEKEIRDTKITLIEEEEKRLSEREKAKIADDIKSQQERFKEDLKELGKDSEERKKIIRELKEYKELKEQELEKKLIEIKKEAEKKRKEEFEKQIKEADDNIQEISEVELLELEASYKKKELSEKDYQKKKLELELQALKARMELYDKDSNEYRKLAAEKAILEAGLTKIQEDEQKKRTTTALNYASKITSELGNELQRRNDLRNDSENREISDLDKNIQRQSELASKGLQNQLAFEQAAKAKAELERKQELKRQQREQESIKLAEVILSSVNNKLEKGESFPKALAESVGEAFALKAIAKTIAGAFFDGSEKIENDLNPSFNSGKDDYLVRVDGKERVLTGDQNKMIGNMSNEALAKLAYSYQNGEYLPKYAMETGLTSFGENISNSLMIHQLATMNKKLNYLEAIANKKETEVKLDNLGSVIVTEVRRGLATRTEYKKPRL